MEEFNHSKTTGTQPTHLAQKCPVCNGFGSLKFGQIVCHACVGNGYILVPILRDEVEKVGEY